MPQPPDYSRTLDFTEQDGDDTNHSGINSELDSVALSIEGIRTNLALIQEDDGTIKAGIINAESVSAEFLADIQEAVAGSVADDVAAAAASANTALSAVAAVQAAALAAASSETAAATSATACALNATAAAGSAAAAAASAAAAATQAGNSATSAAAAAASAASAATQAGNSATSAAAAAASEAAAALSATAAAASETAAALSETNAGLSEVAAAAAQVAAEAARDATLLAYDNFDDRYLGSKAADPALDNDGNALVAGSLYFDNVNGYIKIYTGAVWVAAYISGAGYLAAVNNLSELTNIVTARSNLGLVIGTHVQAYDADLAAIAALVSAADKMIYATGAGAWSLADLTAAGRALVAGASITAQRETLGWSGSLAGRRNRLINPFGEWDQRGDAGLTRVVADDTYISDRWYVLTQTGTVTYSMLTNPEDGYTGGTRITQSQAAAQRFGFAQIIRGLNCKDLRGSYGVLTPRIKCSSSQAIRYAILGWQGTEDAVTSDVVNDWTSANYTTGNFFLGANLVVLAVGSQTPAAATWTTLAAISAALGVAFNNLILMVWTEGTAAQNVTLDFDAMQFEPGQISTPFERFSAAEQLHACYPYCEYGMFTAQQSTAQTERAFIGQGFRMPKIATPTNLFWDMNGTANRSSYMDGSNVNTVSSGWGGNKYSVGGIIHTGATATAQVAGFFLSQAEL